MKPKLYLLFLLVCLAGSLSAQSADVSDLLKQGSELLTQQKTAEAVACYEKVLTLDDKNYDALAFLCNYHFLLGKKELEKIESAYLIYESPTRMQVAQYNEGLKRIYTLYFSKAEKLLIRAYILRKNDRLDSMAGEIADFKERIGIRTPGLKKSWIREMLLP